MDIVGSYHRMLTGELDKASERLKICRVCPRRMKFANVCLDCGCFIRARVNTKKKFCKRWPKTLHH